MASRVALSAVAAILLVGCTPIAPQPASGYHAVRQIPPMVLAFAPASNEPSAADAAYLRALGPTLPAGELPELYAEGPRALARARAVRRFLDRQLVLRPVPPHNGAATDPDLLVLVTSLPAGVLADACLGPGQPVVDDLLPGGDARRARLLPAGCAVASALQAQVAAGAGNGDLLQGRMLPPGASIPYTDAIESYYRRNDPSQRPSPASSGGGGTSRSESTTSAAAPTSTPPQAPAGQVGINPLLGPLLADPAPTAAAR